MIRILLIVLVCSCGSSEDLTPSFKEPEVKPFIYELEQELDWVSTFDIKFEETTFCDRENKKIGLDKSFWYSNSCLHKALVWRMVFNCEKGLPLEDRELWDLELESWRPTSLLHKNFVSCREFTKYEGEYFSELKAR